MFTGLIQRVGVLRRRMRTDGGARLEIGFGPWPQPLAFGESVAVQGACLTVAASERDTFLADVLDETLDCTTLGALAHGARLNLERALQLSDRLGGHIVSGHVDGVGRIADLRPRGRDRILRIACEPAEARYVVRKGSIAIDGVSLTVSATFDDGSFEVNLIPTTLGETTLADRRLGDAVNLETDVLGKYVERLLQPGARGMGVTLESLAAAGFAVE